MKNYLHILTILGMLFTACKGADGLEENDGNTPKIELSKQNIEVGFEPNTYTVSVSSSHSWAAESDNEWIVIESKTGIAGTEELSFTVEGNEDKTEREGTILLTNNTHSLAAELHVTQKAFTPEISVKPECLNFAYDGGMQEVVITSNFEYDVSVSADWLTFTKTDNGIVVSASNYTEIDERSADITISSKKYNISKTVKVLQNGLVILYTSSDGYVITPQATNVFGANIVSNTYANGIGVIKFDAPITSIGEGAFDSCSSLTSITIPNSVTWIGDIAFLGCSNLTSVTIPDSVTSIGEGAFESCKSLISVTIPDSVTSIGEDAFNKCSSLTSVTIGNRVTSIGGYAFYKCSSLTSVTIGNRVTSIGAKAFYDCSLTSVTIPDSVTSIGEGAFSSCSLTSVTIGNRVTSIGAQAFSSCQNLTSVTIPNSVTSIGAQAFSSCKSLTSVKIPDNVISIGNDAFHWCSGLTSVTIGNSVTSIGEGAFSDCTSLKTVYCKPTTPPSYRSSAFNNNATARKFYVPTASVGAYKAGWSSYESYIVGYDF